ncbi:MAG: ThiF family adenylyltransferase [Bdellovibrionales bacterium]|nr:ThiF family adenylyltransferase [Bdellovibrionales bacterium]
MTQHPATRRVLDTQRHSQVFDPTEYDGLRFSVIGVGSLGSVIGSGLAKLGLTGVQLHDFDTVAEHNIANQLFGHQDIGQPKVEALKRRIEVDTGISVTAFNDAVTEDTDLGEVVFICVDSMSARKRIFEGIKVNLTTELLIEMRMGADEGRIYTIDPRNPLHVRKWEENWYPDEEVGEARAETDGCQMATTVGSTAGLIANYGLAQLINWHMWKKRVLEEFPPSEILLYTSPPRIFTSSFNQ